MIATTRTPLYSPAMLSLAVELAGYPFDAAAFTVGEARSRTCGSTLALSSGSADRLCSIGMRVTACAVGQAAAAIFAQAANSRERRELVDSLGAMESWLSGKGDLPDWPRLDLLAPALAHPGRHGAILLPWRAAIDALSKASDAR